MNLSSIGLIVAGVGFVLILMSLLVSVGIFNIPRDRSIVRVEDDNTKFVDFVEKNTKNDKLNKVIKKAIPDIKNGTKLKMIAIDIDVDDEKELVILYKKSLVILNVDLLDEKISYKETFDGIKDENSLRYVYSLQDKDFCWSYEMDLDNFVILQYGNNTISRDDFEKNYYVIKNEDDTDSVNLFENSLLFTYGDNKINVNELEDSMYDDSTIISNANLTYEEIEGIVSSEE